MQTIMDSRAKLIVIVLFIAVLTGVAIAYHTVAAGAAAIALIGAAIIFSIPSNFVLSLLLLTIFIDQSPITFGGSYVRIYQLIFLVYVIKFIGKILAERRFPMFLPAGLSLFLWFATLFLAFQQLVSPSDFYTIVVGQIFLMLIYYTVYTHVSSYEPGEQIKYTKLFITGGIIIVALGFVEYPLIFAHVIPNAHAMIIGIPRPSSLLREPDWYGLVAEYLTLILLTFSITKKNPLGYKRLNVWLALCFIGMVISMVRASWVGFIVGLLFLFLKVDARRKFSLLKMFVIFTCLLVFLIAGIYLFDQDVVINILNRMNPFTSLSTDSGAADSRVASILLMKDYIAMHPWIGNGAGGMNLISQTDYIVHQYIDGEINAGRGNANLIMTSLFDSGIIGTTFLVIFLLVYWRALMRKYKETKDVLILAFAVASLGLISDFMFNNGIRFGFVWIHVALSMAYVYGKRKVAK